MSLGLLGLVSEDWASWPCRSGVQRSHAWDGQCFHTRYKIGHQPFQFLLAAGRKVCPCWTLLFAVGGQELFFKYSACKEVPGSLFCRQARVGRLTSFGLCH